VTICASCGHENPGGSRFCSACGIEVAETRAPREVRKTVTVLFCDVSGSTSLGEQLDPEALRRVMRRYFDEISAVVERHGGTVEKFIGDAVMAVFGIPQVQEDDALRAIRAAAEIRDRLPALAEELGVELTFRTGVNTGPVVVGAGQTLATGDALNVAARLEQAARPGEILIGPETRRLVRDAVGVEPVEPLELKGKSEPVEAYRLVRVDPTAPAFKRHLETPLVGRSRELDLLAQSYERAVEERGCHLFTLLGAAGVGKTRLTEEFVARLGPEATVLRGRCLHYGEGITFWPLVELLVQLGEPAVSVLERVAEGGSASPEELFWEVRKLLEHSAAERPVVAVVDDLHWAEPMLLDLLDHVTDLSRGVPILLVCLARPELLDGRPGWAGGKLNATSVLLEPLDADESSLLLERLDDGLDTAARERVVQASGGNPLFLEEMAALARDDGDAVVPPTIQALLAARLESLREAELTVIERGAVEGEVFHRGPVHALAPEPLRPEVEAHLASLVRKELIRPDTSVLAGDDAFRFRHLLIRDAAYDAMPKETRPDLHERFAGWLEQNAAALVELDELAGWHLEQAVRYRQELGLPAAPGLTSRAADHLAAAGSRAAGRSDLHAADNLVTRALELVPLDDAQRARMGLDLAETLVHIGQLERAEGLLEEAAADASLAADVALARFTILFLAAADEHKARVPAELPAVIEQLRARGNERGLAKANFVLFGVHFTACRMAQAVDALDEALLYARRAGDRGLVSQMTPWLAGPLLQGPLDSATVDRRLEAIATADDLGPSASFFATFGLAWLALFDGRHDDARRLAGEAVEGFRDLGMEVFAAIIQSLEAMVAVDEAAFGEAVRLFRRDLEALGRLGPRGFRVDNRAHAGRGPVPGWGHGRGRATREERRGRDAVRRPERRSRRPRDRSDPGRTRAARGSRNPGLRRRRGRARDGRSGAARRRAACALGRPAGERGEAGGARQRRARAGRV
jgi:class 3 adenylate cyclase/tetratricopeptide (TPR) repeat protein